MRAGHNVRATASSVRDLTRAHRTVSRAPAAGVGGFLPAVKQIANVSCLPGIVNVRRARLIVLVVRRMADLPFAQRSLSTARAQASIGLPDCHSGYGFAIGNVAAFDMEDPEAVVSPGAFNECHLAYACGELCKILPLRAWDRGCCY